LQGPWALNRVNPARPKVNLSPRGSGRHFASCSAYPTAPDTEHLTSCRNVEALLDTAYADLESLFETSAQKAQSCLSCDPRPHLLPLATGLAALSQLIGRERLQEVRPVEAKGRSDARALALSFLCGEAGATVKEPNRNRKEDARRILIEKCGVNFVNNRQGLRQVFRVENDRQGCYQSRACRLSTNYGEIGVEGGFWTYDGEYWYIWAERRTPRDRWESCMQ
jgi:hypothetical protein